MIVLYDCDGTSVGNIRSPLRKVYNRMKSAGLEPKVILVEPGNFIAFKKTQAFLKQTILLESLVFYDLICFPF